MKVIFPDNFPVISLIKLAADHGLVAQPAGKCVALRKWGAPDGRLGLPEDDDYRGMISPDGLRSLAVALENGSSAAERLSKLFYETMKADK